MEEKMIKNYQYDFDVDGGQISRVLYSFKMKGFKTCHQDTHQFMYWIASKCRI